MVHLRLLAKISAVVQPKVIDRLVDEVYEQEQVIALLAETEWKLALKQTED